MNFRSSLCLYRQRRASFAAAAWRGKTGDVHFLGFTYYCERRHKTGSMPSGAFRRRSGSSRSQRRMCTGRRSVKIVFAATTYRLLNHCGSSVMMRSPRSPRRPQVESRFAATHCSESFQVVCPVRVWWILERSSRPGILGSRPVDRRLFRYASALIRVCILLSTVGTARTLRIVAAGLV